MKNNRVLVVEDDIDDHFFIKKNFNAIAPDVEIMQAFNGNECMEYLEKNSGNLPRMITMDLNMPLVNGIECTLKIKADDRFKNIIVVIFSTSDQAKDKERSLQSGADDYVVKPTNFDDLKIAIKTIHDKWLKA